MMYNVDKECFCCEVSFTVLADTDDVEFCPFCGERLDNEYDDLDDDDRPTHNED